MIPALANFFRGIHMFFGATAPTRDAPYATQRTFVLLWFGLLALIVLWCLAILLFLGVL